MQQNAGQQDPHGYVEAGKKRMMAYVYRQFWGMKWVTAALVAVMVLISANTQQFLPLLQLSLGSMLIWSLSWWMVWGGLMRLFVTSVQMEKTNNSDVVKLYRGMYWGAWYLYALQVIGLYWTVMIVYINYFVPEG